MIVRSHSDPFGTRRAWFSDCETYRYRLEIPVTGHPPETARRVAFIMLNPSTATEMRNDPTVARCCNFARAWGFSWLDVFNIFALRSTDPKALYAHADPIGPENDWALSWWTDPAAMIICAWGQHGELRGRGDQVRAMLRGMSGRLHYLKLTRKHPHHPLYLRGDSRPIAWT